MLITRKRFEEELHREREKTYQEIDLNKRLESMERLNERMNSMERLNERMNSMDRRISELEKAYRKATENYSAFKVTNNGQCNV